MSVTDTSGKPAAIDIRPTSVRWGVLAFSVCMAVILYLDRMSIAVAAPAIQSELDLGLDQMGWALSAFFWCYALFQVPAGWLGDRWGGRRVLTLYVVGWSLAMASLGLAGGFVSLVASRALLGVGQAGAFATTASFLRRWIPFGRRGFANSAVTFGGRAGGVLAHSVTPVLMSVAGYAGLATDRWRPVFIGYALVGIVWAVLFWLWFRDRPRLHPRCNAAEVALIETSEPAPDENASATDSPYQGAVLVNPAVQLLGLVNYVINVGWIFLATWLPTYLIQVHGVSEIKAGVYTSYTAASGMAGCVCGGLATDFLVRRMGLVWGRRIPAIISYGGASLGLATCWTLSDASAIVAVLIISSFFGDFGLGSLWATYQDIGGPFAGTVLGYTNMCGNFGAACAISAIPLLVTNFGWSATFAMSSSFYLIGAVTWFFVDPRTRLRV